MRPTAIAAKAAVMWWRPHTGMRNGVPKACGELAEVTTRKVK